MQKVRTKQPKKETKPKTYVITVSQRFLTGHPKAGQPTNFVEAIKTGKKKHTIRGNYTYWYRIVKKCQKGEAVLSLRYWSGKPYQSKQVEIMQCPSPRLERVRLRKANQGDPFEKTFIAIGDDYLFGNNMIGIAKNDGFDNLQDFLDWFHKEFEGCIIYFNI